jgi:hypothetical protein
VSGVNVSLEGRKDGKREGMALNEKGGSHLPIVPNIYSENIRYEYIAKYISTITCQ